MIVSMVHWKNMVRPGFMKDFTRIAKALCYADASSRDKVLAQVDGEIRHEYVSTYESLRRCGYETTHGNVVRWHGWYAPYLENNELRFKSTAPPESRNYISKEKLMEFIRAEEEKGEKAREFDERLRRMVEEQGEAGARPSRITMVEERDVTLPSSSCSWEPPEPP